MKLWQKISRIKSVTETRQAVASEVTPQRILLTEE